MGRLPFRTPSAVDAAARWTAAPIRGWKYWLATVVLLAAAWALPERWELAAAVALIAGLWLRDRFLASPDLDAEAPRDRPAPPHHADPR